MTVDDFLREMRERSDADLVGLSLEDDVLPFVFDARGSAWTDFRGELASALDIKSDAIRVVGSGRFGFSLKPFMNFRNFRDHSDIDLVIVSDRLFDAVWYDFLTAAYPRPPADLSAGGWIAKARTDLYTGWLAPQRIQIDRTIYGGRADPILRFRVKWFDALKRASRHAVRRHESINGRLYRTWRHAGLYHLHSLRALRQSLEN